jgi:hypothetical protein
MIFLLTFYERFKPAMYPNAVNLRVVWRAKANLRLNVRDLPNKKHEFLFLPIPPVRGFKIILAQ